MSLASFMRIAPEVREALASGRPVVALESTLISHGLPFPENVKAASGIEQVVRESGAVPATIAVIDGVIRVGLDAQAIERLATDPGVRKLNAGDLPVCVALGLSGSTTVAATMACAEAAGIEVFATGGIGGVHRGFASDMDVSHDLPALAAYRVAVVTAGAKAILDLPKTLEYLETLGVPVLGYGTDEFPAFWCRESGLPLEWRIDSPEEAARVIRTRREMGRSGGVVIANPIPAEHAADPQAFGTALQEALNDASTSGIRGKKVTPFLLKRIRELSGGASLAPNTLLLENNARLGAGIAKALSEIN